MFDLGTCDVRPRGKKYPLVWSAIHQHLEPYKSELPELP